jgi:anaerobic magnesium-protoporphyrin IX monomethyl ester cyclase
MSLLLSHGYFLEEDPKEKLIMRPYPPLGILYISAYLKQHGFSVQLLDSTFSTKISWKQNVLVQCPKVIAFYVNLMTKLNVLELTRWVKSQPQLKATKIIFGGPDVTHNSKDYLLAGADFIMVGEGEQTMLEWVRQFESMTPDWSQINGLRYLNGKGEEIINPPREKLKEIDDFPVPDRSGIDLRKYIDTWKKFHGQSTLSISTQRGCPYTCKWCSTAVYGQSYRRRKPTLVVEELKSLLKEYNPDSFWFVDDVFTISHKWLEEFNDALKAAEISIQFECITRADRLNEAVIKTLKEAGCFRVWIGAESGSQDIIDAMDRRVDVMRVREMIIMARQYGIQAGTFIMLGYPGETRRNIEETITHLKDSLPDQFTITIAYPIKGTGLFKQIEAVQLNIPEWESSTDRERDFKRVYPRGYYKYAVSKVVNEVNFEKYRVRGRSFSLPAIKHLLRYRISGWIMDAIEVFNTPKAI